MEIRNRKYINYNLWQQEHIAQVMPISNLTEKISLKNCLGRKLAVDIFANSAYPAVALSAISGKFLNIQDDITTVEQYKEIETIHFLQDLMNGENPFIIKEAKPYLSGIAPYMKIGGIANTVISLEQHLPWFRAAYLSPEKGDVLADIKKGTGIVNIGADYLEKDLILKKDDIITNAKKALLRQADVSEIEVYKKLRFAVLCVDYDLENLNKNFEMEYIQDCMQSWGFDFEVIKIKPFKNVPPNTETTDDSIATSFETYLNNIHQLTQNYDYIVACGLADDLFFKQLGLFRSLNELRRLYSQGEYNQKIQTTGNHFRLFSGALRSDVCREDVRFCNEQGRLIVQRTMTYEDKALMGYISGYILDIIVNMHLLVKPTILQRMYREPVLPEWKIGVLSHDYSPVIDQEYKYTFLWACVSPTTYDERYRIVTKEVPEIKIINVENERPDMLNFFKECNCFIPIPNEEHELRAGDYFYYLEI
ncbi:MoeA protein [Acinetobacter nematophilus]|uniref:Molybdopterin molybdenumtransferase n=1 Tax=Acinetobacter nematophilus TaxID=2994642 RepID=A0A9X3IG50_9GAMM|nr:MoeA protein [Acinetobacter nematophilus]MCX5467498.1 MoeA protein [Acinetobacter nematophilus]